MLNQKSNTNLKCGCVPIIRYVELINVNTQLTTDLPVEFCACGVNEIRESLKESDSYCIHGLSNLLEITSRLISRAMIEDNIDDRGLESCCV